MLFKGWVSCFVSLRLFFFAELLQRASTLITVNVLSLSTDRWRFDSCHLFWIVNHSIYRLMSLPIYSKTCLRWPPLRRTDPKIPVTLDRRKNYEKWKKNVKSWQIISEDIKLTIIGHFTQVLGELVVATPPKWPRLWFPGKDGLFRKVVSLDRLYCIYVSLPKPYRMFYFKLIFASIHTDLCRPIVG